MRTIEEVVKQFEHICWYPSAGSDLRVLLFLSDRYYDRHNVPLDEGQKLPDLYILTDLRGLNENFEPREYDYDNGLRHYSYCSCEPGSRILHASFKGRYTDITVKKIEELNSGGFSYDPANTVEDCTQAYNSAILLEMEVETKKYGTINRFSADVLYISVQNEFFAKEFLIPQKTSVEYLVLIRYGYGTGGARIKPTWIIQLYKELGIKYLISNDKYVEMAKDEASNKPCPVFEELYSISGVQWSDYGPVLWNRLT